MIFTFKVSCIAKLMSTYIFVRVKQNKTKNNMKKTILIIALALVGTFAFAQKPTAGSRTAEVSITGAGLNSLDYALDEFRFRYFISDDMAVRCRFNLGSSSSTYNVEVAGATTYKAKREINEGFSLSFSPGIEKHFAGTDKLSPYAAAQIGIMMGGGGTDKTTDGTPNGATGITGAQGTNVATTNGSIMAFGLGLAIGADYYFTDAVYIGGEFGIPLYTMVSIGDGKEVTTVGGASTTVNNLGASASNLFAGSAGLIPTAGVRLGMKW